MSLLAAIQYLEGIGGDEKIHEIEQPLISYALQEFEKLSPKITLIGPKFVQDRVGIFSFTIAGHHATDIAERLAEV